ncbi:nucleotidyltransferase family protein [Proteobacteria bacterium 005FR1]|nr:nucleotidyltransferase family protein [Proteobacteria bacterium 005FR1]
MNTDFSTTNIAELAAIIAEHLQGQGIEVVLVGGLAVEIYTENLYLTNDIDLVNTNYQEPNRLHSAMGELGFRKKGRVYVNNSTDIAVEFPSAPLSVGDELIKNITRKKVGEKSIPILAVEDVVKDRLAAFIHWRDRQSLVQAVAILLKHGLTAAKFKNFCGREGTMAEYQLLHKLHRQAISKPINSMADLEPILTQLLLEEI